MKKLIVSLCVCLTLTAIPFASQAADHPRAARAGGVLSSALVGGAAGLLAGAVVAAFSQSTSGTAIGAGVVIGAALGAVFAIMNPAPAEAGQPPAAVQPTEGKDAVYPPGEPATAPSILHPAADGADKAQ